ncbi:MAG: STAS domain-containing protein [Prevotellaceae bacterium]|jgi:anti-anti-sigma factor|nr:STAS domain-containing protein [Prevotellaceae bacterium]
MLKVSTVGDITEVKFDNLQKLNILVSENIKAELQKLFDKTNAKVLINMDGVRFLDSSGFAAFLSVSKLAGRRDGQIIFCNVCNSAMDLFKVLQLHTVFRIIIDREEALHSFR